MSPSDESISVEAPASQDLGAQAMKAQVATSLFGEAAHPIMIGRYEVVETIGAGGMGEVYAAWDKSLGRRVALKLLPAEQVGEARERARLVREAQALAKLSHPNVVHVYEVAEHEGGVYVAMELVEGDSLKDWQSQRPRTVPELVGVYLQAGHGLVAAHQAGLVHRDFKPANVLVGRDGRVRVVDFGLALGPGLAAPSTSAAGRRLEASPTGSITRTGALAGTPAYMAPEQFAGGPPNARADQFSFCVALYEAVVGCRPFDTVALTMAARRPTPSPEPSLNKGDRRVPWWLARVLRRGLAIAPQGRWPGMEALLRAMEARRRWRRLWMWSGPILVGGGALALLGRDAEVECAPPARGSPSTWRVEHAQELRIAVLATGQPFAEQTWSMAEDRLERYATAWNELYVQTCRDARPERAEPVLSCLLGHAHGFTEVIDRLTLVDAQGIVHAEAMLDTVGRPEECITTIERLRPATPIPAQARVGLAKARVAIAEGRYRDASHALGALEAELIEGGSPVPEGLFELRGRALARLGNSDREAREALARAAAGTRDDEIRARAQLTMMELSLDRERFESMEDQSLETRELIAELGSPDDLQADYLDLMGRLWLERKDNNPSAAAEAYGEALSLRKQSGQQGRPLMSTMRGLANAHAALGERADALRLYEQIAERYVQDLGAKHPDYAAALFDIGLVELDSEHHEAAQTLFERALAIEREVFGDTSTKAARTQTKLAETLHMTGQQDQALRHARSAWSVQSRLPEGHTDWASALEILASIELELEIYDDALAHHLQIANVLGTEGAPGLLQNIAWAYCQVDRCPEARPWVADARIQVAQIRAFVEQLDDGPERRSSLLELQVLSLYFDVIDARIEHAEGRPRRALELLEAILTQAREIDRSTIGLFLDNQLDKLFEEVGRLITQVDTED